MQGAGGYIGKPSSLLVLLLCLWKRLSILIHLIEKLDIKLEKQDTLIQSLLDLLELLKVNG